MNVELISVIPSNKEWLHWEFRFTANIDEIPVSGTVRCRRKATNNMYDYRFIITIIWDNLGIRKHEKYSEIRGKLTKIFQQSKDPIVCRVLSGTTSWT